LFFIRDEEFAAEPFADMRALLVIPVVTAVFLAGCDPGGLRRVQVRLPQPPSDSSTMVIHQPDVQEALRVLDRVVEPLGFKAVPEQPTNGYVRVYVLSRPPVSVNGQSYSRDVPIRVTKTPAGIEVAFGEFGFLAGTPEPAVRAFKDARAAFVKRYGRKNVGTKTFGSANKGMEPTGASRFGQLQAVGLLRLAPAAHA
jgi:hypothetical protein